MSEPSFRPIRPRKDMTEWRKRFAIIQDDPALMRLYLSDPTYRACMQEYLMGKLTWEAALRCAVVNLADAKESMFEQLVALAQRQPPLGSGHIQTVSNGARQ